MIVDPKVYKGIEYVRLEELPELQKLQIKETLNNEVLIKILVNGVLVQDCIQYKDYVNWFKTIYKPIKNTSFASDDALQLK